MQTFEKKLFKYSRTHSALVKMNAARDKFMAVASQDRYAAVGLALMEFTAELLEKTTGFENVAGKLRDRASTLRREAEQALLLNRRSKRQQIAVGARPAQVAQVVNGLMATKQTALPIPQTAQTQPIVVPAPRVKRKYTRRQPVPSHQGSRQQVQARGKRQQNVTDPSDMPTD